MLHIAVNVVFVLAMLFLAQRWPLTILAVLLVLLSKWRIFAVQPRFWLPNLKANLVDVIVGLSTVGLIHQADNNLVRWTWAGLYLVWLLFLKPKSSELWVAMQALWSQLLGMMVLFNIPFMTGNSLIMIVIVWIVAWSSARHFLSYYDEPHYRLLSLVWAFLVVQLVWIRLHWLQFFVLANLKFSATTLIVTTLSIVVGSLYHAYKKDTMQRSTLIENVGFGFIVIGIILFMSKWSAGN